MRKPSPHPKHFSSPHSTNPLKSNAAPQRAIQPKVAGLLSKPVAQGSTRRPVAPPVYRPQPVPKVLQQKSVSAQQPHTGQTSRRSVVPLAYDHNASVQSGSKAETIIQPKAISQVRTAPKAPPVYRPKRGTIAQPKMASAAQAHTPPKAPAVYLPLFSVPKKLPQHLSRAVQPMKKWGVVGSTPSFLQDPDKGKSQEELWPALSSATANSPAPSLKPESKVDAWKKKPVTALSTSGPNNEKVIDTDINPRLAQWKPSKGHDGMNLDASLVNLETIVDDLNQFASRKGCNPWFAGDGSNKWQGTEQLKLVHQDVKVDDKNATFHITLIFK